jgi:hypothetical protein
MSMSKRAFKRGFYDAPIQSVIGKKRYDYLAELTIGEEVKKRIFKTKRDAIRGTKKYAYVLRNLGEIRPMRIDITAQERSKAL